MKKWRIAVPVVTALAVAATQLGILPPLVSDVLRLVASLLVEPGAPPVDALSG